MPARREAHSKAAPASREIARRLASSKAEGAEKAYAPTRQSSSGTSGLRVATTGRSAETATTV